MHEPTGDAYAALSRLAAAIAAPSAWPGFAPGQWPLVLTVGDVAYCLGHPDPGLGEPVAPGPWGRDSVLLPEAPTGLVDHLAGLPTAFVEAGAHLAADAWRATFRLHLRHRLRRLPPEAPPDGLARPAQAALAELEDRVRAEALASPATELVPLVRALCLIRRERHADCEDDALARERAAEVWEGLPAYVAGAEPPGRWGRSGSDLALLLNRLDPIWPAAFSDAPVLTLDQLLERHVRFDGGAGDDDLLLTAQARHQYPRLLSAARARTAAERVAREALFSRILTGEGSLLVVDVSELGEGFVEADDAGQRINAVLSLWSGEVAFRYRGAEVFFRGVPVAMDRRAGVLQARVPGRLRVAGDGEALQEPAAFGERLEVDLPGVSVRARNGWVQPLDGGLYVKIGPAPD